MSVATAVILVAGIGQRLRPLTEDRPKALVEVEGETILARALRLLIGAGVQEVVLATGYREDQIRRAVEHLSARVTLCPNPNYQTTQNSVSLALCRAQVEGRAFFKLDGDVVFQPEVLTRLGSSSAGIAVAVDRKRLLDAEAMKARIERGRIVAFGKGLPPGGDQAETIGIERLDAPAATRVFNAIDRAIASGRRDLYYEDLYSEVIREHGVQAEAVDVSDLPWSEVDNFEDLERACDAVRQGSSAGGSGA